MCVTRKEESLKGSTEDSWGKFSRYLMCATVQIKIGSSIIEKIDAEFISREQVLLLNKSNVDVLLSFDPIVLSPSLLAFILNEVLGRQCRFFSF